MSKEKTEFQTQPRTQALPKQDLLIVGIFYPKVSGHRSIDLVSKQFAI